MSLISEGVTGAVSWLLFGKAWSELGWRWCDAKSKRSTGCRCVGRLGGKGVDGVNISCKLVAKASAFSLSVWRGVLSCMIGYVVRVFFPVKVWNFFQYAVGWAVFLLECCRSLSSCEVYKLWHSWRLFVAVADDAWVTLCFLWLGSLGIVV